MTLVLLVNPPNTTQVLDEMSCTVTRPEALTDWIRHDVVECLARCCQPVPKTPVAADVLEGCRSSRP